MSTKENKKEKTEKTEKVEKVIKNDVIEMYIRLYIKAKLSSTYAMFSEDEIDKMTDEFKEYSQIIANKIKEGYVSQDQYRLMLFYQYFIEKQKHLRQAIKYQKKRYQPKKQKLTFEEKMEKQREKNENAVANI